MTMQSLWVSHVIWIFQGEARVALPASSWLGAHCLIEHVLGFGFLPRRENRLRRLDEFFSLITCLFLRQMSHMNRIFTHYQIFRPGEREDERLAISVYTMEE